MFIIALSLLILANEHSNNIPDVLFWIIGVLAFFEAIAYIIGLVIYLVIMFAALRDN